MDAVESFELEVVTPQKKVFTGRVDTVVVPGFLGQFGVLPGHVPYITALRPGPLNFDFEGTTHRYVLGPGFAEVGESKVTLVTDGCEPVSEIELQEATEAMKTAEQVMLDSQPTDSEYLDAEAELALQGARVQAATDKQE